MTGQCSVEIHLQAEMLLVNLHIRLVSSNCKSLEGIPKSDVGIAYCIFNSCLEKDLYPACLLDKSLLLCGVGKQSVQDIH